MSDISDKFDSNDVEAYVNYLKSLQNFDSLLENGENFSQFLVQCHQIVLDNSKYIQLVSKTKIYEFFSALLQHICSIRLTIDFKSCTRQIDYFDPEFNRSEKILHFLYILNYLLNTTFLYSTEARRYFNENIDHLRTFMIFLNDIEFISEFTTYQSHFDGFINTLYFLSESSNEYKQNWLSLDSTKIVLNFARLIPKWNFVAYAIIALIASDQEMESMDQLDQILSKFIPLTIECIREPIYFYSKQFHDQSESINASIRTISGNNGFVYLIDYYLNTLYGYSINEKFREKIFFYEDLAESVKFLVYDGNDVEKFYALKLLTQLSFNENIKKELGKDKEFFDFIKEVNSAESFEFKKLKAISSDFIWLLSKSEPELETLDQHGLHIMVSYNTASREMCLKIKTELEKTGLKIWIDVNEIHGSSLDSMAKAIENSSIILMCVSEKYRQSINCQAEAQYAFRLNKTIIPLIMQPGYHNVSGWLGIIIGDKIFVDFTKYNFEESLKRLKNQINLCFNKSKSVTAQQPELVLNTISDGPKDWDEEKVKTWFQEHGILNLFEILKPLNGGILFQMYELKMFSPEFFYKSLTSKEYVDIKMISVFTYELVKLFGNT